MHGRYKALTNQHEYCGGSTGALDDDAATLLQNVPSSARPQPIGFGAQPAGRFLTLAAALGCK